MRTDLPNPKRAFPFLPPCTFSSFFPITCSHTPSLLLPILVSLPLRQFPPLLFFSTLFAATFLALFLIQPKVYSPFLRSPRKSWSFCFSVRTIWSPLALHVPASEGGEKQHPLLTLSASMNSLLLSSEKARKRLVCATKGLSLPYSWVAFLLNGDKQTIRLGYGQWESKQDSK